MSPVTPVCNSEYWPQNASQSKILDDHVLKVERLVNFCFNIHWTVVQD